MKKIYDPPSTPTPPTIGLNNGRIFHRFYMVQKKTKKCGYRKFSVEPFKSYGKIKILGCWRQLFDISSPKIFPGETSVLSFRTIFLAHSGEIWGKSSERIFRKVPKTAKNGKKWLFSHNWAVFEKTGKNLKKAAVLCFWHFLPQTSCQVSEKSSEWFLR